MTKDEVTFPDFQKLDFRVGKVVTAEVVAGSVNLIRLQVDLGSDYGIKQIITGIAKWYTPEQLVGRKFVFVANLAPKKMMKEESRGMILCVDQGDQVQLIPVDGDIAVGSTVR